MPAISIQGLRKTYRTGFFGRKVPALRGVDLDVRNGEIYGLLGANGAGKTTTIKILLGLLYPDDGEIEVLDRPLGDRHVRRRVGYLPENPYFYEYLDARESLRFYGKLQGVSREVVDRVGGELLERLDLGAAAHRRIREYSKGMRQRFGVAQALVSDPDLVVLDEPLEGLDPRGRRLLKDLFLELRERGKAVLFSSHILADVEEICDRVCVLHQGRVLRQGELGEILQTRATAFDLRLRDVPEATVENIRAVADRCREEDGVLVARVDSTKDPRELVRTAVLAGATVDGVIPLKETLEEFFVRESTAFDRDTTADRDATFDREAEREAVA